MIVKPRPAPKPQRAARRKAPRKPFPVWPAVVGALLLAAVVGGILLTRDGNETPGAAGDAVVQLAGVGAYDPDGGDGEHDDEAGLATDDDPATFWRTSRYRSQLSAFKSGVGLVVRATGEPQQIALTTDTPGFTAEIQTGSSPDGPFETVGASKLVGVSTTWELDGEARSYYVVWITELVGSAHINELKAS